jgi:hypothetical protein
MNRPLEELERVGTLVVHHLGTDEIREVALDNEEGIEYVATSLQNLGLAEGYTVYKGPYHHEGGQITQLPLATPEERAKLEAYL